MSLRHRYPALRCACAAAALLLTAAIPLQATAGDKERLPVLVGGRAVTAPDGALRFGWPGVYIEGRFRGPALRIVLHTGPDRLRLLVDGLEQRRFDQAEVKTDVTIEGLGAGEHSVRLEKLAETQGGSDILFGFYPAEGSRALPAPARRARQIEFIGDSYTVGYGNSATGHNCSPAELRATTDTQQAFGPIVARYLGADYRIHAYSGFGIVRNYNGNRPGESLPGLYQRLIPGDPEHRAAKEPGWRPRWIVINLGTNDFSTPLHAGERWREQAALRAAYRAAYIAFARGILARQPQARLILMGSSAFIADVEVVAAALRKQAPRRVSVLRFGNLDLGGCDWHPSLQDHRRLAALVEAEIARAR